VREGDGGHRGQAVTGKRKPGTEPDLERRLRAWNLKGRPAPRPRKPRTVREAAVLMAHHSGQLVLGGSGGAA